MWADCSTGRVLSLLTAPAGGIHHYHSECSLHQPWHYHGRLTIPRGFGGGDQHWAGIDLKSTPTIQALASRGRESPSTIGRVSDNHLVPVLFSNGGWARSLSLTTSFLAVVLNAADLPQFHDLTISTDLKMGYQIVVADLNRDGKPDL